MQKIVKKGTAVLLVVVLAVVLQVQGYAANLGTLRYWESNADWICRWGRGTASIPVTTYYEKLNGNSAFAFSTGMQEAAMKWGPVLNSEFYMSTTASSSRIKFYGGTKAQIDKTRIFNREIRENETGMTYYFSLWEEGTWKYGTSTKTGYKTDRVFGAIVDMNRTTAQYKNTCLHEFGHALGWMGHSASSSDIMYSVGSSSTTLTNADKRHIRQVYYK